MTAKLEELESTKINSMKKGKIATRSMIQDGCTISLGTYENLGQDKILTVYSTKKTTVKSNSRRKNVKACSAVLLKSYTVCKINVSTLPQITKVMTMLQRYAAPDEDG
eukprot:NODE_178_length_14069_cov_0.746815.p15 type:complete len:108 gc:universal NODE_178_length_14069_cov_0.746815:7311-7634(+)